MKNLLVLLTILFAHNAMAHGPLLDAMKEMGAGFKVVAMGLQAGAMTNVELEASERLQMGIANASLHYP